MKSRSVILAAFIALVWIVSLVALALPVGTVPVLIPRTMPGLMGVFTMPLVHGSVSHLVVNTAPLAVFAYLVLIEGTKYFLKVTSFIVLLSGLGVWGLARTGAHVGASGLIFGYFGFLLARGLYHRQLRSILIAVAVAFVYGGMIWGVLPTPTHVSWEAHLSGLLAGGIAARFLNH